MRHNTMASINPSKVGMNSKKNAGFSHQMSAKPHATISPTLIKDTSHA
jgi:hypothetical protein